MSTNNLTAGCKVRFTEPVFVGSYRNATCIGERTIVGTITAESYGQKTGQHTFTIAVESASGEDFQSVLDKGKIRRKGRNLYRDCETLSTPPDYQTLLTNKYARASAFNFGRH
jgi:hypothetical protein